ncbi:MAG: TetR/AcrR family transcriptional regulator [Mogibacterium sp.]|nr:TetR/AcrR family transcriptional regulator [Mogibacterium sp.]MBR4091871.1 TetR/AcrR family transcriptional regulator [Mogibacterium sp.]
MRVVKTAEERKNEILDVAEQLFAEKGFDNASTNDIINRIGIARGTLYHHFASKEEILDAIVDRMTRQSISRAAAIIADKSIPLLQRLSSAVISLNINTGAGVEVFEQIHRPQNALLHQKMQERLMSGVVPLIAKLIEEGNADGTFDSAYPDEAAEMIMTYANVAFDALAGITPEQMERKSRAFICHTERILGAEKGSLDAAIMKIFENNSPLQ